jgi:hypothetical protein
MALFTNKAARGLPILTTFRQVEYPDQEPQELPMVYDGRLFASELGVWERAHRDPLRTPMPDAARGDLVQLAALHRLVSRVMDAVANKTLPAIEDQDSLDDWIRSYLAPRPLAWVELREGEQVCGVMVTEGREHCGWEEAIIVPILRELHGALVGHWTWEKTPFRRCDECQSPYVLTKKSQRFCSTRCRQRQGQRLRMRALFARP